jgi:hypothetical protein
MLTSFTIFFPLVSIFFSNVAEMLLTHGLGGAVRHRDTDEDRSSEYDKLLAAEKRATDNKKGIHNPKDPPTRREPVDVSKVCADELFERFGFFFFLTIFFLNFFLYFCSLLPNNRTAPRPISKCILRRTCRGNTKRLSASGLNLDR